MEVAEQCVFPGHMCWGELLGMCLFTPFFGPYLCLLSSLSFSHALIPYWDSDVVTRTTIMIFINTGQL